MGLFCVSSRLITGLFWSQSTPTRQVAACNTIRIYVYTYCTYRIRIYVYTYIRIVRIIYVYTYIRIYVLYVSYTYIRIKALPRDGQICVYSISMYTIQSTLVYWWYKALLCIDGSLFVCLCVSFVCWYVSLSLLCGNMSLYRSCLNSKRGAKMARDYTYIYMCIYVDLIFVCMYIRSFYVYMYACM